MRQAACFVFFSLCLFTNLAAQRKDSLRLKEVTVVSYFRNYPFFRTPASVAIVDSTKLAQQSGQSLVSAMNTVAGVHMEERSPGSYRLSIRGSLIRSPFGIRNVKIYMDEFPLTDAGGNTYLNLLDANSIQRMEIVKGPDGSLFGANSGGVIRLSPAELNADSLRVAASIGSGSYALFREHVLVEKRVGKSVLAFSEGMQHCDGYRVNSALDRKYVQFHERWNYSKRAQIRVLAFYSKLDYQTPGGLTLQQVDDNPRAARPATATVPGAAEQKAGVHNSTLYGGILHEIQLGKNVRQVTAVFGSHTNFENPFITNYEVRDENSLGIRTWLEAGNGSDKEIAYKWNFGFEAQHTRSEISNYGNRAGIRDTLQASDQLQVTQGFVFTRISVDLHHRLIAEAALSLNDDHYAFQNSFPSGIAGAKQFSLQLMPRLAFSYRLVDWLNWRASVSKGYSPPTLAEIRSSDNQVNTGLEAERGWNYETGFRVEDRKGRIRWDIAAFYYQLNQAIVSRENAAGISYFVNAGGTKQLGIEVQTVTNFIQQRSHRAVRRLRLSNGSSLYHFVFSNYSVGTSDYSGNLLTGVPNFTLVSSLDMQFPLDIYLFVQHAYYSGIPLNDANTVFSDYKRLVQLKVGWQHDFGRKFFMDLHFGIDNLLNNKYSLGNDLNAVGGRYYNPAPGRNYFAGVTFRFR